MITCTDSTNDPGTTGQTKIKRSKSHGKPTGNTTDKAAMRNGPTPPARVKPAHLPPPSDESRIDTLLVKAGDLYKQSEATDKLLLDQRVELGRVLIELKEEVGHGNFIEAFHNWSRAGRIDFSLKTGERAMAYAELEGQGKFVDAAKIDIVTNLADAERLRKAEAAGKKAEKRAATTAENEEGDTGIDDDVPVTLTKLQINCKASQFATPVIEACRGYDVDTKRELIEEIIELLTKQLES
jgi:hypothetical protein